MVRKKRRQPTKAEPTTADWDAAINRIKIHSDFDQETFRTEMEKLARELDKEGQRAHRNADWLEGLSYREEMERQNRREIARFVILWFSSKETQRCDTRMKNFAA